MDGGRMAGTDIGKTRRDIVMAGISIVMVVLDGENR
jgi:hypothetical protein